MLDTQSKSTNISSVTGELSGQSLITFVDVSTCNLKTVTACLLKGGINIVTGPSGAGKTALAVGTIYKACLKIMSEVSMSEVSERSFGYRQRELETPQYISASGLIGAVSIDALAGAIYDKTVLVEFLGLQELLSALLVFQGRPYCVDCGCFFSDCSAAQVHFQVQEALNNIDKGSPEFSISYLVLIAFHLESAAQEYDSLTKRQFILNSVMQFVKLGYRRFIIAGRGVKLTSSEPHEVEQGLEQKIFARVNPEAMPDLELLVVSESLSVGDISPSRLEGAVQQGAGFGLGRVVVQAVPKGVNLFNGESLDESWPRWNLSQGYYCPDCQLRLPQLSEVFCRAVVFRLIASKQLNPINPIQSSIPIERLDFYLGEHSLRELLGLNVEEVRNIFVASSSQPFEGVMRKRRFIADRLSLLCELGLGELKLDLNLGQLSSGERIKLVLASLSPEDYTETLFVLDEPWRTLHPYDLGLVLSQIRSLVAKGNTFLITERFPAFVAMADRVLELGPAGGDKGGQLLYSGAPNPTLIMSKAKVEEEVENILYNRKQRSFSHFIEISQNEFLLNNEENIKIPLRAFVVVLGVAGAGKTRLLRDRLLGGFREFKLARKHSLTRPKNNGALASEFSKIKKVTYLSANLNRQRRSHRLPQSHPRLLATEFPILSEIAKLFASTAASRIAGFTDETFLLNRPNGLCEKCFGFGSVSSHFGSLGIEYQRCELCAGARYQRAVLKVNLHGLSIAEVLELSVFEALAHFASDKELIDLLQLLSSMGLAEVKLGEDIFKLSDGHLQCVRLSQALQNDSGSSQMLLMDQTLAVFDQQELELCLKRLDEFIDSGGSLVVSTHDPRVILHADYVIELNKNPKMIFSGKRIDFPLDKILDLRHL